MNRRKFVQKTALALAGGELLMGSQLLKAASNSAPEIAPIEKPASISPPPAFAFASAPMVINPAPDGATIACLLNDRGIGWVEYGETEALGQRCDGAIAGLRPFNDSLSFRLSGLKPGKSCFYRVHATKLQYADAYHIQKHEEIVSQLLSFRTLDHNAPEISFTVWNDTHQTKPTLEKLIAMHRKQPTDFLFWNGDIVNDISQKQTIIDEYFNPAGQAFADTIPYFMTRGNHDVRGEDARLLPQYVDGPQGQYYYSFRHGPVGFLVLDTGEDKPDNADAYAGTVNFDAYRIEQQRWLELAIQDPVFASAPIRIAFLHIPLVWDGAVSDLWKTAWNGHKGWISEDSYNKWNDLFVKAGVKLVISGHTHHYAWYPANAGRPYGQLIGGGPALEAATALIVKANSHALSFEMKDLNGQTVLQGVVPA